MSGGRRAASRWVLLGAVVAVIVIAVLHILVAPGDYREEPASAIIILVIFGAPIGGGFGAAAGYLAQRVIAGWRTGGGAVAARGPDLGDGLWMRRYRACATAVWRFREAVTSAPDELVRESLEQMGEALDAELERAHRLARVGYALDPGARRRTVHPRAADIDARLHAIITSFEDASRRARQIANGSAGRELAALDGELRALHGLTDPGDVANR